MTTRPHPDWIADAPALRAALVEELVRVGAIRSGPVREAFGAVPRELFVPDHAIRSGLPAVYSNGVVVTKRSRSGVAISSSSQPQMMAAMLELLAPRAGDRILEIGTGTGYNAALLRELVGPSGHVVSVEVDPDVAATANARLELGGYTVEVVAADGRLPVELDAPVDGVIVTASSPVLHRHWSTALREGGRSVVPLRLNGGFAQVVSSFRRIGDAMVSETSLAGRFMSLRDATEDVAQQTAELVVRDGVGRRVVSHLAGGGIDALSDVQRDQLGDLLREPPRRSTFDIEAAAWPLTTYLALELDPRRLVVRHPEISVGLVAPDGSGVALVEGRWSDGNRREPLTVVAHGSTQPESDLRAAVDEWIGRGRPELHALEIEIAWVGDRGVPTPVWRR